MHLDARTLDDHLDEWISGLSSAARKELAALARASGGDPSALESMTSKAKTQPPRKPPQGTSS